MSAEMSYSQCVYKCFHNLDISHFISLDCILLQATEMEDVKLT